MAARHVRSAEARHECGDCVGWQRELRLREFALMDEHQHEPLLPLVEVSACLDCAPSGQVSPHGGFSVLAVMLRGRHPWSTCMRS